MVSTRGLLRIARSAVTRGRACARGGRDEPTGRISGKLAREDGGERRDVRRERQHRHAIHEILDGLADRPDRPQVSPREQSNPFDHQRPHPILTVTLFIAMLAPGPFLVVIAGPILKAYIANRNALAMAAGSLVSLLLFVCGMVAGATAWLLGIPAAADHQQ